MPDPALDEGDVRRALTILGHLPEISDGTCLSARGAEMLLRRAVGQLTGDLEEFRSSPNPYQVSEHLLGVEAAASRLAGLLENLPKAARARIASVIPDWLFTSQKLGSGAPPYHWEMTLGQARNLSEAIPFDSADPAGWHLSRSAWDFFEAEAAEFLPGFKKDGVWLGRLKALGRLAKDAAGRDEGSPEELGGARSSFREIWAHPYFLFLLECDALLIAALLGNAPKEMPRSPANRRLKASQTGSWTYHSKLPKFSRAVFACADLEKEGLDPLAGHLPRYANPFGELRGLNPWVARAHRVVEMRIEDLDRFGNRQSEDWSGRMQALEELEQRLCRGMQLRLSDPPSMDGEVRLSLRLTPRFDRS